MNYSPAPKFDWNRSIGWNLDRKLMKISERILDGAGCYPWTKTFVIWPRKTITGQRVWLSKIYKRRFWAVYGDARFHMEPEVEYATMFEILSDTRSK